MKTVIKDGQKFNISDALYEATKRVNPMTANSTSLGQAPTTNNSNIDNTSTTNNYSGYEQIDYPYEHNDVWLDYMMGKKNDGSIDAQNTPIMSKISKEWQIIYNVPKFTEKIKIK